MITMIAIGFGIATAEFIDWLFYRGPLAGKPIHRIRRFRRREDGKLVEYWEEVR